MESNLEKYIKDLFLKHGKKIRFNVGQSVSSDTYITASVNYIYSGEYDNRTPSYIGGTMYFTHPVEGNCLEYNNIN